MYLKIKDHASIRREGSGLAAYVHTRLAAIISDKTVKNAIKNGTSEHYDSVTGKPLGIPDYCMSSSIETIMSTPLFIA